ncbi:Z1 domain-containing protein [Demequina subtropica]|uniref:Z1 domain-containing protein n=1 Tax=Demequina subtropica TaxID=1638989 RepID=UPI000B180191|nr:Z1 domain-containing protein [Demequina subtropica]
MTVNEAGPRFGRTAVVKGGAADRPTWWSAYESVLAESGIGRTSRSVIQSDAEYIVERGVFGAGDPGVEAWPESRQRSGVVMGAVQSGKTASMMAVTALAMDRGVDCIVVLAGTRRSLWLQTLERFIEQIDVLPNPMARRDLMPTAMVLQAPDEVPTPASLYAIQRQRVRSALKARRPIIAITMKNVAHLEQVSRVLRTVVAPEVEAAGRPFHVLVIDDEADDSSIDNVVQEPGAEALSVDVKQVPRRIRDLWEPRGTSGATFNDHYFATYVAYTATPQANFLQDPDNPLAPRDFVIGLRAPGAVGETGSRTSTYRVPEGLSSYYTGGDVYYQALASVPMCVPSDDTPEQLIEGVRAFLVAAAIRRLRAPERQSPAEVVGQAFATRSEAREAVPPVSSMLVNPASAMGRHFEVAGAIHAWSAGTADAGPTDFAALADRHLRSEGIAADMDADPDAWTRWLTRYAQSADAVSARYEVSVRRVPPATEWGAVREVILREIVPATTLAVINSDEHADDRPQFSIVERDGRWYAPANLSTIFVSGNVMSRGLTLDGLLTTVFTRSAENPLADTQMQMQRWFGYRGSHIDLCRVFMRAEQIDLFTRFHENDEALRSEILRAMDEGGVPPDPMILQGRDFLATGKIAAVRGVSLSPGQRPFFTHMNPSDDDEVNRGIVAGLMREPLVRLDGRSSPRGVVLERRFSMLEVADLLDSLAYSAHGADPQGFLIDRWASVARTAGLEDADPHLPLYRAQPTEGYVDLLASPFSVAAYLRYWDACLNRDVPGLYTTDEVPHRWSLLDLQARKLRNPRFSVGVRFGGGEPVVEGQLADVGFLVRPIERAVLDGRLRDRAWGSQSGPYGDDFFDLEARGDAPVETTDRVRPTGSDGLILFHVIDRGPESPTISVACSIPRGGPDFVQARRREDG